MKQLLIILIFSTLIAAQTQILIDEDFSDWNDVSTMHSDASDDGTGGNSNIDFQNFWVSNDEDYLYFRIQTGDEVVLIDDAFDPHFLTLFIDTDNDPNTGKSIKGLGAELEFNFANRDGKTFLNGGTQNIEHYNLGFVGAPTFSANEFEFAVKRSAAVNGTPIFSGSTIKVLFVAYSSWDKGNIYDFAPDNNGYEFTFQSKDNSTPEYSINKKNEAHLRVVAYNVKQDGILEQENTTEYNHIFSALNPEIIGFTEVYDGSSQQVAERMEFFLPSEGNEVWYHKKEGAYDIVLLSRFAIKQSFTIDSDVGHDASGAFIVDLRPKYDSDLLVIVSHPKCCGGNENDNKRQNQFDAIIQFLRNAVKDGGALTINENTPIIVMGDMNLVGDRRQYVTLTTGDIKYESNYGSDFVPDWDGSNLDDAIPYTTNTGFTYTTNSGGYPPGRLDFIFYTGSVMNVTNSFNLDAAKLTSDQLSQFGLSAEDTKVSDHLPVVADFEFSPTTDIKKKISPK